MNQKFRFVIVFLLLLSILFLARNNLAGAVREMSPDNQAALSKLSGFVWEDADQDGVQDVREPGLPNVAVDLYDNTKTLVNTTITDARGRYQFEGLQPGDYYVHFLPPSGFVISPKDQGQNESKDSDADSITGETVPVNLKPGENTSTWDAGLYLSGTPPQPGPGTVKPPPPEVTVCDDGTASVGGVSTLHVNSLAPGYCLAASSRNNGIAVGRIPDGAGTVLANITFLRVFYNGSFVYQLPSANGQVQICYAIPATATQFQIYFFDFYGPRTGGGSGQPSWQPLETTVTDEVCASAQTSGAYALIGK